eukprot:CAMPEP_0197025072 /NCGR_PEP_ID=MMETSP1384-20130603/5511_1 /TAXON_ID=29189 /ORGANISM="Ammonia sp." /LENGTH=397 /DNA_ID=CAMNT_0042453559 /DNA_START=24 /DNA_END=1214 /DNA_ORIENTATION=-
MAEREVLCPFCQEVFVIQSQWTTTEIMCGSCGQIIDMEKFSKKDDPKSAEKKSKKKQKLNNNATRTWLHGRMAVVPTPGKAAKGKLGGKKANKLPMLTGVKNVLDSDEEEEERQRKLKKKEERKKRKQQQKQNEPPPEAQQEQEEEQEEEEEAEEVVKKKKSKKKKKKKKHKKYEDEEPEEQPEQEEQEEEEEEAPRRKSKKGKKRKKAEEKQSKRRDEEEAEADEEEDNDSESGYVRRGDENTGFVRRGGNKRSNPATEDNINHDHKIDDDEQGKQSSEPLKTYNTHNISSTSYKINSRPKEDDSDEWEEIAMEEEVTVSKPKASGKSSNKTVSSKVQYIDDEDDAKNIVTSTKGMNIEESDEDESSEDEYFKRRKQAKQKQKTKKTKLKQMGDDW